jgi:hypothetical protein
MLYGMVTVGARRTAWSGPVLAASLAAASLLPFLVAAGATYAEEPPAKAEAAPEFKPPPGFRTRKRGDLVLYCRREAVLGTRFPVEKCYDEAGVRALWIADLKTTDTLGKIRACGTRACSVN